MRTTVKIGKKNIKLIWAIIFGIIYINLIYLIIFVFTYYFSDTFQKTDILEKQIETDKTVKKQIGFVISFERLDDKCNKDYVSEYWKIYGTNSNYAIIELWYDNKSTDYKLDSLKILETYNRFKKGINSKYRY